MPGNGEELRANLEKVLEPDLPNFTPEQARSAVSLLEKVSAIESAGADLKRSFVAQVQSILDKPFQAKGTWG